MAFSAIGRGVVWLLTNEIISIWWLSTDCSGIEQFEVEEKKDEVKHGDAVA